MQRSLLKRTCEDFEAAERLWKTKAAQAAASVPPRSQVLASKQCHCIHAGESVAP